MQHIDTERGVALLNGISNAKLREVDQVAGGGKGDPDRRVALIQLFKACRRPSSDSC